MSLFGSETKSSSQLKIPDWMKSQIKQIPGMADDRILNRGTMNIEDMVAGMNPAMLSAIGGMSNWSGGQGGDFLSMLTQLGMDASGGISQGMDWLSQSANRGPAYNNGPDMSRVAGYANDPYMDSMISAALRDPARALTEQQLPAARMAQAMSGNTGSSRGAIGEAVLQRGFDDRAADVGAMMRGNAWNQGLGVEADRSAMNAGFDQNFQQLLANLGGTSIGAGTNAANIFGAANSMGVGNMGVGLEGGMIQRGVDQEFKNAGIANFNQPMMDLLQYSGLLNPMAQQFGKTVNQQSQTPGLGSVALAAGGMMMGMPGGMGSLTGMFGGGGAAAGGGSLAGFNPSAAYRALGLS